jgi:1,3-beta-glucan synthase
VLLIFVVIIAAPVVLHNTGMLDDMLKNTLWPSLGVSSTTAIGLLQPLDHGLNDTVKWYTGSGLPKGYTSSAVPAPSAGQDQWRI